MASTELYQSNSMGYGGSYVNGNGSWFKPETFLTPDFNPDAYVAELRKFVPLETVSAELESHLAALKNKLVEVINEDYNDFVSLSTKLVNIDGSVLRMQKPLLQLKEQLVAVQGAICEQLDLLREGLARRQAVASARATLELMQDTAHVMSKVEKLVAEVGEVSDPAGLGREELDSHARLLERVAGEVARLKLYATRGQDLPFIQQLGGRISGAGGRLEAGLGATLRCALDTSNSGATFHCLHAYAAASNTGGGEDVIRSAVVAPIVAAAIEAHRGDAPRGASASVPSDALRAIYADVAGSLRQPPCSLLLEVTLSPSSGLQAFNLLGNAVLAEVDEQLAAALPGVFSSGAPAAFHANYLASMDFIAQLEAMCVMQATVLALRGCGAYGQFSRRWKMQVYYSLRFQEVAGALEGVVGGPGLEMAGDADDNALGFRLAATAATWRCIAKCAADEVLLVPLADKFLKLALQLLARYAKWMDAALEARRAAEAGGDGGTTATATEGGGDAAAAAPRHWALRAQPEAFALVLGDVDRLAAAVQGQYVADMERHLAGLPPQVREGVRGAVAEGVTGVQAAVGAVLAAAAGQLVEKCVGALKQLRGIVATFRMTNKALPTRPSHYVAAILVALRQFLDSEQAGSMSEAQRTQLTEAVVDGVTCRYQAVVDDTLTTVRRTESSLKRLKTRRAGEGGDAGGEGGAQTDTLICRQLFLDVQEYGRNVVKFGAQPASMASFRQLWKTVAPPDQAEVEIV